MIEELISQECAEMYGQEWHTLSPQEQQQVIEESIRQHYKNTNF